MGKSKKQIKKDNVRYMKEQVKSAVVVSFSTNQSASMVLLGIRINNAAISLKLINGEQDNDQTKLVRPQMTAEARDILKSWDGETNSEKVKAMDAFCAFAAHHSKVMHDECTKADKENEVLRMSFVETSKLHNAELKEKAKELSTIAGYLAISICINFVAIGWVAWTKGGYRESIRNVQYRLIQCRERFKKDMRQSQLTKKRETKRNIHREADDFASVLAGIYPAYFGDGNELLRL